MTKIPHRTHGGSFGNRTQFRRSSGFTLIELLLVLVVIGILAALLLPVVSKAKKRAAQTKCLNHLRQVGIAAHAFAHDHTDGFPFQVSTNSGGTAEFVRAAYSQGGSAASAFRHFQALSNELAATDLLICPADDRTDAAGFTQLHNENLSFFIAVSSQYSEPDSILAGDRNLAANDGQVGPILRLDTNTPIVWTGTGHEFRGNLLFADGRVENTSRGGLLAALQSSPGPISAWAPVATPAQSAGTSGSGSGGQGGGSGSGGTGGGGSGGSGSGGSGGFATLQNFFQQTPVNNPSPNGPPSTTPAESGSSSTRPPTAPPPVAPPPPAMAQNPPKPAPDMAKAGKPGDLAQAPAIEKPVEAAPGSAAQQPVNIMVLMMKPETCWSCWLAILLGALLAAVLMAWAIQRQRQQRREEGGSVGQVSSDAGPVAPASRSR
jgi:prepilin-type N-terminal cleavage/methylation domain-containing protein/prepilin-type processing-associated H-X9-DG protein